MNSSHKLVIEQISKSYGTSQQDVGSLTHALESISLYVKPGEFVTLFGPNGCGKTTLLNIISGILIPDSGNITIDGKAPSEARIGYIFQNYVESLFPWLNVIDNVSFSAKLRGMSYKKRQEISTKLLDDLSIEIPNRHYPYQLSGGQKQLVAIARALLFNPDILVMDEPFSALDYETRFSMQTQIQRLWEKKNLTVLFVSHEIDEAIFLADRLVLLTRRPAKVKNIFSINMPRPRTHEMMETDEFLHMKAKVLHEFREVMEE